MADRDPVRLTRGSARKIRDGLSRLARQSSDLRGRRTAFARDQPGFWIILTAEGTGGDVGWYTWKLVLPQPTNPVTWVDAEDNNNDPITGTLNAREANDRTDLAGTQPARYFVDHIGYDDAEKPIYIFHAGNLPTAQYQHMYWGTVVNNGTGFERPLAQPAYQEVETSSPPP